MSEQDIAFPASPSIMDHPASATLGWRALEIVKWGFSFPVMLGAFLVGRVFWSGRGFLLDPDVWWHIKDGLTILATHRWPTTDPYSFTVHGQPWIAFEWGGEVLIGWVSKFGVQAMDALWIGLGSAVVIALYVYGTIRTRNSKAGFLAAGLLSSFAIVSFTLRPQMLGYLYIVLTLIILERFRQGKSKSIWLLPPLMLVWINTHGSWPVGLGTFFVYWMCGLVEFRMGGVEAKKWKPKERWQLALAFLLSAVVLPLNPYGTRLVALPFQVAAGYPICHASVQEWLPMLFNTTGAQFFLLLFLAFVVLQMAYRFTWRLDEMFLCLFGFAMACIHVRFVMIFVPFFTPIVAVIAARWLRPYDRAKDKYVLNAVLIAGVVVAMIHYFPTTRQLDEKVAANFPVHAVEYLREHPVPGAMFDSYDFGGYLIWSGYKTFIDGRGEIFEDGGVLQDYLDLSLLQRPGGLDVLRRYNIQSCILGRDASLSVVLADLPGWQKVYSDNTSVIFVRRSSQETGGSARVQAGSQGRTRRL